MCQSWFQPPRSRMLSFDEVRCCLGTLQTKLYFVINSTNGDEGVGVVRRGSMHL